MKAAAIYLRVLIFCLATIKANAVIVPASPCETIYLKSGSQMDAVIKEFYERKIHVRDCASGKKYELPWELIDSISNYTEFRNFSSNYSFIADVDNTPQSNNTYQAIGLLSHEKEELELSGNRLNGTIERIMDGEDLSQTTLDSAIIEDSLFNFIYASNAYTYFLARENEIPNCDKFTLLSGLKIEGKIRTVFAESISVVDCSSGTKYTIPYHLLLATNQANSKDVLIFNETRESTIGNYSYGNNEGSYKIIRYILYTFGCIGLLLFWLIASLF